VADNTIPLKGSCSEKSSPICLNTGIRL